MAVMEARINDIVDSYSCQEFKGISGNINPVVPERETEPHKEQNLRLGLCSLP